MTLPQMTYITLVGGFKKGDNTPEVGSVTFRRDARLVSPGQSLIVTPWEKEVPLQADGTFSVDLPATDDGDYSPTFTYEVIENLSGGTNRYFIQLPASTPGGTVNLASKAPVAGDFTGDSYVLTAMIGEPNGVAGLGPDGLVPLEQLPPLGSGGGGGTGTPASSVVEETNYGQSSAVGTGIAYARADHTHGTPPAQTLASLGAEAAGTAQAKLDSHVGASDPHGDRAYSDAALSAGLATKAPITHTHGASSFPFEWYVETAVVGEGLLKKRNNTSAALTIIGVRVEANIAAPQGGPLTVDVDINGTTIFTTQANRPSIPSGSSDSGLVTNMNVTTIMPGQYLTVDIDAIGLTVPGSGILVSVVVG